MVGDTPEEPKEQKEQLNGIAFINQCHIMHSVHRLESPSTVHKQKVYESFGNPLVRRSLVRYAIQAVFSDPRPALRVKISCVGLRCSHIKQCSEKLTMNVYKDYSAASMWWKKAWQRSI